VGCMAAQAVPVDLISDPCGTKPHPGSGKTHTMSGREEAISDDAYLGDADDGIVSRSVRYLFHQVGWCLGGLGGWVLQCVGVTCLQGWC
jgi:hypothetical protein